MNQIKIKKQIVKTLTTIIRLKKTLTAQLRDTVQQRNITEQPKSRKYLLRCHTSFAARNAITVTQNIKQAELSDAQII